MNSSIIRVAKAKDVRIAPPPDFWSLYLSSFGRGNLVKDTDALKLFRPDSEIFTSNWFRILFCNWGEDVLLSSLTVDTM